MSTPAEPFRALLAAWTEPRALPPSRARLALVGGAWLVAVSVGFVALVKTVRPIVSVRKPPGVADQGPPGVRFGMPENVRKDIFREIATAEPNARAQGIAGFPDQPWSQEDHRAAFERDTLRSIAARRGLALTQVYLVLDEGIREGWPGPDGKPLTPMTIPLVPRRK